MKSDGLVGLCILLETSHTARWLVRSLKGRQLVSQGVGKLGEEGGGPISGEAQWFVDPSSKGDFSNLGRQFDSDGRATEEEQLEKRYEC